MDTGEYLKQVKEKIDNMSNEEFMKIVNNYMFEFVKNPETIYIISTNDKPVKITYEDLPCPMDSNSRCKNAEMVVENDVIMIKCNHQDRDICIFDTRNLIDSVRSF